MWTRGLTCGRAVVCASVRSSLWADVWADAWGVCACGRVGSLRADVRWRTCDCRCISKWIGMAPSVHKKGGLRDGGQRVLRGVITVMRWW